ncbi:hypothetical protein EV182_005351 [Spiromyces aspiralis]|uniref:Uncharacterized protein n=1 Tax=Spiromyces aspiralis TaxID=68401 RepID=A0ACC1HVA8_9FUNG|nr:hypothetical protein EV182_005351 [Spiromyces aspiralis]
MLTKVSTLLPGLLCLALVAKAQQNNLAAAMQQMLNVAMNDKSASENINSNWPDNRDIVEENLEQISKGSPSVYSSLVSKLGGTSVPETYDPTWFSRFVEGMVGIMSSPTDGGSNNDDVKSNDDSAEEPDSPESTASMASISALGAAAAVAAFFTEQLF